MGDKTKLKTRRRNRATSRANFVTIVTDTLNSKRFYVENKAKLSQMKIINKQKKEQGHNKTYFVTIATLTH